MKPKGIEAVAWAMMVEAAIPIMDAGVADVISAMFERAIERLMVDLPMLTRDEIEDGLDGAMAVVERITRSGVPL